MTKTPDGREDKIIDKKGLINIDKDYYKKKYIKIIMENTLIKYYIVLDVMYLMEFDTINYLGGDILCI